MGSRELSDALTALQNAEEFACALWPGKLDLGKMRQRPIATYDDNWQDECDSLPYVLAGLREYLPDYLPAQLGDLIRKLVLEGPRADWRKDQPKSRPTPSGPPGSE